MSATHVAVLTPPGTAAIATIAVSGPEAWNLARARFRPVSKKLLPDTPILNRFWFGTLGDGAGDEVVLAVTRCNPHPEIEVHCHGGKQVVRWLVDTFVSAGCIKSDWTALPRFPLPGGNAQDPRAVKPLTQAPTFRTASILLDQWHGAFVRAVEAAMGNLELLDDLVAVAPVGRHLVSPWKVVIAGAPNVGKSSLINALAGYQRSIVAPIPGTTRDVVTTQLAFDGWPMELADTAGLRDAQDSLEAEGVDRARAILTQADLLVWVIDGSDPHPVWPDEEIEPILVVNKSDLPLACDPGPSALPISATTGDGVAMLTHLITRRLIPSPPATGAAVPFLPALADTIETAAHFRNLGKPDAALKALATCLP